MEKIEEYMFNCVVSTASDDSLALSGARPSAVTVMAKIRSYFKSK